ncbi:unnamed protein product [Oikopleura dioica]|uniref:Uncharacterized protein n=1 Tax=Oikopleura dioica TaxID=34765 RepID=E4XXH5_OIKDI|nr:unnamed protein product [Oikopleura dioica]CBY41973.1 unnamed protein product [Oikopleura dioica]
MWLECLFITSAVVGKFFGSGDHFESDDEDLEKVREEQVFALFYEAWVPFKSLTSNFLSANKIVIFYLEKFEVVEIFC